MTVERDEAKGGRRRPRVRIPLPTRRLIALAGGAGLVAVLVPLFPPLALVHGGAWLFVGLLVLLDLAARPRRSVIRVERLVGPDALVGREASYTLRVASDSRRQLVVTIRDVLPPPLEGAGADERFALAPREAADFVVSFIGLARGRHPLLPIGLRVESPLGLLAYQDRVERDDAVDVSPGRPKGETEFLLSRIALLDEEGGSRSRHRHGAEQEFESLREYVVGDEVRRIDWKATARRRRPQVRQYETERSSQVILALDCGRIMGSLISGVSKLDLVMTPVLDLAAVALKRRERIGLLAFDSRPRLFLPPRTGLSHLGVITRSLGRVPAAVRPTSFLRAVRHLETHHRKRAIVLVFTDFTDDISAEEMLSSLASLRRRHALMFVATGDPHLREIADGRAEGTRAVMEKAVASQLLIERRRTVSRIERLGIPALDAEPQDLSGPLIRRYLDLRLRGWT